MGEFRMPTLGADMTEGRIVAWHVAPGDEVHHGDIVATVDTSKAEIDVEIFEDGVVQELLVDVGEKVPVGTPLAIVDGRPAPVAEHHVRVSPLARRVAADLGVDPGRVTGTGPHGSVVRADIEAAAGAPPHEGPAPAAPAPAAPAPAPSAPPPAAPAEEPDRAAAMRTAIGALMARSTREIPHYHLAHDIDLHRATAWLERRNADVSLAERMAPAALLLAATARAAAQYPDMNGLFVDGTFQPSDGVHLGIAISLRAGGLVTPAIRDAQALGAEDLMGALRDLVRRARGGGLRASELAAPTITVTDLGDRGVDLVHGVIYPPQVALVGFGAIRPRAWAEGDALAVRPVVTATVAADHRVSDGHRGALFLREVDHLLQHPDDL